jgi:hypothetical protein
MYARNFFGSLGQGGPVTGISFGYNEASRWYADAQKVVDANPNCALPIVDRFRAFVNGTPSVDQLQARLDMTPSDMQGLEDFRQCQIRVAPTPQAIVEAAAQQAYEKKMNLAGLAGAAIAIAGLGYFISKAS